MKRSTFLKLKLREAGFISRALVSSRHPVLAHVIPMRRCNLACGYCNEYDKTSDPVPLDEMKRRLDKLASFGTSVITISGGEPMMHPQLDDIIRHIRECGMIAGLISNGYYMTPQRIKRLNDAGLQYLQISIDNLEPDEVSQKSLKMLDKKLRFLAEHADFHVNINSVIGGGIKTPEDALVIGRRAVELGFSTTVGVIHDNEGMLKPLGERERKVFYELKSLSRTEYARFDGFQNNLADGKPNDWRCRAGARYLYICEDGLVHHCSQQRGYPGIPLADYTTQDIEREYNSEKWCAPFCTVACVHKVSILDNWRDPQKPLQSAMPEKTLNKDTVGKILRAE
ncbi:MAG TPA: radical SAM protein [Pyrinomonadaceae bacterium]|jgi:MoaA/NifB/PqqE/SkfB family radical SAM enzyme|nr:radical SAM protein [Pyrinomonadaceae bacterium]